MSDRRFLWAVAILLFAPASAGAQTPTPDQTPPSAQASAPSQPQMAAAPGPAVSADKLLSQGELEALVAPIALYPDSLMSLVLMASTYPLEVVQADRFIKAKKLKGDQLKAEVDKQGWDDSVKALSATPTVVAMMSTKLDWTQKLGDAVLAQQEDVMDAVQRLRARAQANDKLKTTKEQKVTVQQVNQKPVVVIEQADPSTVYVPAYDPGVVYGAWPYAEYPPAYFPDAYGYGYPYGGALLATGLAFGAGYALGRWASGGCCWGGGANWGNRNLVINNRPVNINNSGNRWQHNAEHRHGVRYSNANVAQKFGGGNNLRDGAGARQDFRGRDNRPAGGDRAANLGDRNVGNRDGGNRDGVGNRDGANRDRAGAGNAKGGDRGGNRENAKGGDRGGNRQNAKAGAGNRGNAGKGGGAPRAAQRPAGGGGGARRDAAFGNVGNGGAARANAARGYASMGSRSFAGGGGMGGGGFRGGGGGFSGGGGGFRGGGGGGGGFRGGGGGGRRSDIRLKQDIVLLGHLDNGLGFYRFRYRGESTEYVGVMAQEVQQTMPNLVSQGRDGYLRVHYGPLGVKFQTYDAWLGSNSTNGSCAMLEASHRGACVLQRSEP